MASTIYPTSGQRTTAMTISTFRVRDSQGTTHELCGIFNYRYEGDWFHCSSREQQWRFFRPVWVHHLEAKPVTIAKDALGDHFG